MVETNLRLEQGILFYATLYITSVLIAIFITTGRFVFLFIVLLTMGLTLLMKHAMVNYTNHLSTVGAWSENIMKKIYDKVNHFLQKTS